MDRDIFGTCLEWFALMGMEGEQVPLPVQGWQGLAAAFNLPSCSREWGLHMLCVLQMVGV